MRSLTFPAFAILAGQLLLPSVAHGQGSSPILGFYKFTAPAGNTAWSAGLVTKTDFQSKATSVASGSPNSTITQAAPAWTAGTVFNLHYVEFLDDPATPAAEPWTGLILDIVSNTDSTLAVKGTFASFAGLGATPLYAIRKHATLGTLFANGAGLNAFGDVVTLFQSDGSLLQSLYNGAGGFVNASDFVTPTTNAIVYPGQGWVLTTSAPTEITIGGGEVAYVKSTPTKVPIFSAPAGVINLLGPVTPLVATNPLDPLFPSTVPMSQTGILGSSLSAFSDLVTVYKTDGSILTNAVYITDGVNVIDGSDFATIRNTDPFMRGQAFSVTVNSEKYFTLPVVHPIN
jgi:hypothetical protein